MKIEKWLVIHKPRSKYSSDVRVELKVRKPALKQNEVAVKFDIEIPYEVFDHNKFEAVLEIPKESVMKQKLNTKIINL